MLIGDSSRRRGGLPAGKIAAVLVVVLLLALVQLVRPIARVEAKPVSGEAFAARGAAPALPWPAKGAAAVGVSGLGMLAESNPDAVPRPIASVAKIMTAVVILEEKPLLPGQQGPAIAVTDADVASYQLRESQGAR